MMIHTFSPLGPLHVLGSLAFAIGVFFLLVRSVKTLPLAQLKKWGLILAIGGLVVCVLSAIASVAGHRMMGPHMMREKMLMRWNDGAMIETDGQVHDMRMMDHGTTESGMTMSMDDMTAALEGKTGDDFDRTFLELMVPHHQGAIDMAKLAEGSAKHEEIKAMTKDILTAQQREIDQMNQWLKDWGYAK
jgi:hypothetical protein